MRKSIGLVAAALCLVSLGLPAWAQVSPYDVEPEPIPYLIPPDELPPYAREQAPRWTPPPYVRKPAAARRPRSRAGSRRPGPSSAGRRRRAAPSW
jgi:hypothetical protein